MSATLAPRLAAALPQPALTDHAFSTPHGQLLRALRPFHHRPLVTMRGDVLAPLHAPRAQVLMDPQPALSVNGFRVCLPIGTQVVVEALDPITGYVHALASGPGLRERVLVSGDVLQASYDEEGVSLLEQVLSRLPTC